MLSSGEIASFTKLKIHSDFMMLRLLSSFNEARRSQLYIAFTMMSVKKKSCGDQSLISAVGLVSCSGLNTSNWELLALSDGPILYTLHGVENVPFNYTCLQRKSSFQLHMQRKIHLWSSLNKSGKFVQFLKLVNFFWQNDALSFPGTDDATTVEGSDGGHVVM